MINPKFQLIPLSLAVLMLFVGTSQVSAQGKRGSSGIDVTTILRSFDANKNGYLDTSEMSGRTKDFVRRAGMDPNRAQSIEGIARVLREKGKKGTDKNKKASGKDSKAERKVPGFGVEIERFGVADFSPSGEERMSDAAMRKKFGDSVMAQVDRTMSRYDKDKNGLIDPTEQKRTRWTNPSASESDTNKDTNLSRLELAYRYKQREDDTLKRNNITKKNTVAKKPTSTSRTKQLSSSKNYSSTGRQRGRSNLVGSPSRATASTSSRGKPGFNTGNDAYIRYAEGLLKNYDKNKDKKLSKKEMEEMRRPPKNADTNKDGFVDKNELIASVNGGASTSKNTASNSRGSRVLDSKRRESTKNYNKADSIFGGKDENDDKQLQMKEFSDKWDEEKIAEFNAKDLNGDGVITAEEWTSR